MEPRTRGWRAVTRAARKGTSPSRKSGSQVEKFIMYRKGDQGMLAGMTGTCPMLTH